MNQRHYLIFRNTLKVILYHSTLGIILECLTIPAIERVKIRYPGPLIPRLISMFSRSHEPSRLQKFAYRTIPLGTGKSTSLLNLTPQLIELDIDVPRTPSDVRYSAVKLPWGER